MISQEHRFHGYNALRHVYSRGQSVRGAGLILKFSHNPKRTVYRAAVVVSKKVSKSAVVRNRIRRRIYEIIGRSAAEGNQPYDLVFTVLDESLATMPAQELEKLVIARLKAAGITTKP